MSAQRRLGRTGWVGLGIALALAAALAAKPFDPNAPKKQPAPSGPKPTGGPLVPRLNRRVVVVSLDGASFETLQQLWQDDLLDEGGFERFFREGTVAPLVPVNPTVTSPNHISLATGGAPDQTGIVGNHFHPAGAPDFEVASGFTFPIAGETLWEALRRQKRRTAVIAWPGADDTGPRRRGDLGVANVNTPEREARIVELGRDDWQPATPPPLPPPPPPKPAPPARDAKGKGAAKAARPPAAASPANPANPANDAKAPAADAAEKDSARDAKAPAGKDAKPATPARPLPPMYTTRSPLLLAHLTVPESAAAPAAAFDVFAVDRTDDQDENYDGLIIKPAMGSAAPAAAAAAPGFHAVNASRQDATSSTDDEPVRQGDWAEVSFASGKGRSVVWIKVMNLDPQLAKVRLYVSGTYKLHAYPADFVHDLEDADLAWPGPPDDRRLAATWHEQPGIDLDTWVEQAQNFATFFGGAMRSVTAREDWDLLMGYVPVIDTAGHMLLLTDARQALYTPARRDDFAKARRKVWQVVDRELRLLLASVDLGRTTVVVVSDHGMAPLHTMIDLNALLAERGLLAPVPPPAGAGAPPAEPAAGGAGSGGIAAYAVGDAGMAHVYLTWPRGAGAAAGDDSPERRRAIAQLRDALAAWRLGDDSPIERVLTRQEASELGLAHPSAGDLLVFAREGYAFDTGPRPGKTVTHPASTYGTHGYLSSSSKMQGIYLAIGKDIKPAAATGSLVSATDVARRVAGWLGVDKPRTGNGTAPAP